MREPVYTTAIIMEFVMNTNMNVYAIRDFPGNFVKSKIAIHCVLRTEVNATKALAIVLTDFKVIIVNSKYHTHVDMDATIMVFA